MLVNAPAVGDAADWDAAAAALVDAARGARPDRRPARAHPGDLERETGAAGGAIYGARRTGGSARCAPGKPCRGVRGLWRAGGTAHPGGGLPLVMLGAARVARAIGPA